MTWVWTSQPPSACASLIRSPSCAPGHRFHLDQPRQIGDARFVGQPMHRTHLIDEDGVAEWLVGRDLLPRDHLDLVLAATERDHEVRMIVDVERDRLAGLELHLPHADVVVLEQQRGADWPELDAALGGGFEPVFVVHARAPYFAGNTAMALISIR